MPVAMIEACLPVFLAQADNQPKKLVSQTVPIWQPRTSQASSPPSEWTSYFPGAFVSDPVNCRHTPPSHNQCVIGRVKAIRCNIVDLSRQFQFSTAISRPIPSPSVSKTVYPSLVQGLTSRPIPKIVALLAIYVRPQHKDAQTSPPSVVQAPAASRVIKPGSPTLPTPNVTICSRISTTAAHSVIPAVPSPTVSPAVPKVFAATLVKSTMVLYSHPPQRPCPHVQTLEPTRATVAELEANAPWSMVVLPRASHLLVFKPVLI